MLGCIFIVSYYLTPEEVSKNLAFEVCILEIDRIRHPNRNEVRNHV
jgi:hypothetical protein